MAKTKTRKKAKPATAMAAAGSAKKRRPAGANRFGPQSAAKKKAKRGRPPKKKPDPYRLSVKLGDLTIGDNTGRFRVAIDRAQLTLKIADHLFGGKRLTGRLCILANGESPDQQHLEGMETKLEITTIFETKSYSVTPKRISAPLNFALADVDLRELPDFARHDGTLIIENVGEVETNEVE